MENKEVTTILPHLYKNVNIMCDSMGRQRPSLLQEICPNTTMFRLYKPGAKCDEVFRGISNSHAESTLTVLFAGQMVRPRGILVQSSQV